MAGKVGARGGGVGGGGVRGGHGTEERCRTAVEQLRWPEGFVCPVCGGREGTRLSTRPKIQCGSCRHQASATAGTIFAGTKLPLTRWFLAIRLIATAAEGITSVELGRRLGIKQTSAWALKRKPPSGDGARRLAVPGRPPPAKAQAAARQGRPQEGQPRDRQPAREPSYPRHKMNGIGV